MAAHIRLHKGATVNNMYSLGLLSDVTFVQMTGVEFKLGWKLKPLYTGNPMVV